MKHSRAFAYARDGEPMRDWDQRAFRLAEYVSGVNEKR